MITNIMTDEQILNELKKYSFYHRIEVKEGIYTRETANTHFSHRKLFKYLDTIDFKNKKVLDVGCRDGVFCFYAEKKGAKEVIGIDNFVSKGTVEFLIPYFNSKVKIYEKNLFDLSESDFGKFDIILFFGVLYHLREPISPIKRLSDLLEEDGLLLCETAITDNIESKPIIYVPYNTGPYDDPTSCTFFNVQGLKETFMSLNCEVLLIKKFIDRKFSNLKKIIKNILWLIFNKNKFLGIDLVIINRVLFIVKKNKIITEKTKKTELTHDYWYKLHKEHQN